MGDRKEKIIVTEIFKNYDINKRKIALEDIVIKIIKKNEEMEKSDDN